MPQLACLMLTSFDDEDALLDAIMAGASGHVLKHIDISRLLAKLGVQRRVQAAVLASHLDQDEAGDHSAH
jgi:DNA-binding NarL/FixJ family response regulator